MDLQIYAIDTKGNRNISGCWKVGGSYLCKPRFILRPRLLEQGSLPFVIGLLTETIFSAPGLDAQSAGTTFRDALGPQGHLVLMIQG